MFPSQSITLSLNAVLSLPYLRLAWPLQVKHWVALQAQVSINPAAALAPQESLLTEASIDFRCMHTPPPPPLRSASNSYSTGFTCKNHSQGCRHHLSRTCHSQTCSEIARLCLRCLRDSLNLTWPSQCNPKFLLCFLQPKASSCDFLHSLISLISFLEQTAVKCPVLSEARDRPALHSHPHSLGHLRKGGTREEAGKGGRWVHTEQEGDSMRPGWTNFRSKDWESGRAVTWRLWRTKAAHPLPLPLCLLLFNPPVDLSDVCSHLNICHQLGPAEQEFSQFLENREAASCESRLFWAIEMAHCVSLLPSREFNPGTRTVGINSHATSPWTATGSTAHTSRGT